MFSIGITQASAFPEAVPSHISVKELYIRGWAPGRCEEKILKASAEYRFMTYATRVPFGVSG